MKKLAIAGASMVLAAMPVLGVFADDDRTVTDTINVTVSPSCTFSQGGDDVSYAVTGTNASGLVNPVNNSNNTHSFTVFCNNNAGYNVTAVATALSEYVDGGTATGITDTFAYKATLPTASDEAAVKKDGAWNAAFAAGTNTNTLTVAQLPDGGTSTKIISSNQASAAAGETWTATYTAWIGTETPAATYRGTISYTLAMGA